MSRKTQDQSILSEKLRTFLTSAGWTPGRQARGLSFFYPPPELGVQGSYSVALPDDPSRPGVGTLLHSAADSLIELYGYSQLGELLDSAAVVSTDTRPARIVSRFVDAATRSGAMPLHALGEFLSQLEKGLYSSAKFKLGGNDNSVRAIASRFARECLFLQTQVGSFIASVEVPKTTLRQSDLFGHEAIESSQVCSSFFSAVDFLNARVLNATQPFDTQESLADAVALFDVELLEVLSKMIVGPGMDSIDFTLEIGNAIRTSKTGWITEEKTTRLTDYVAFIKQHFRGENDLMITGTIVELRSRDPESNKNFIRLVGDFRGDRTFVSALLSNEQYQRAVDAHRTKRPILIRGNGTRLRTQIRISEITEFVA
ncbi:hypothetical protein FX016_20400 [Cupriavidus gilardii]|nr:hypothetical protein FX016_20400 [Cupriavidus gilardii]